MAKQKQGDADELEQRVRECTDIFPEAIQEEYVRLPSDLAYWNKQYAEAQRVELKAKARAKRARADAQLRIRQEAADDGRKMTDKIAEAETEIDADVAEAEDFYADAVADRSRLYGVVDAVRAKKDMLVSLGAHVRAELEGDPSLRAEARNRRVARDG